MSKFGGGGAKCTICDKTAYPAETIMFEKRPFHVDCFRCNTCNNKMEGPAKASQFDSKIYCKKCFASGGFAQKQRNVTWNKSEGGASNAVASKFGGGGVKCTICEKTVYSAEQVSFEKKPYHAACFKCMKCDKKMAPSSAAAFEDEILCTKCFREGGYTAKQAKTTGKSGGPSNALASKFGGGGTKCTICEKTVYPAETVSYEKQAYHAACFKCLNCAKLLSVSAAEGRKMENGSVEVYCKKCWGELGLNRAKVS